MPIEELLALYGYGERGGGGSGGGEERTSRLDEDMEDDEEDDEDEEEEDESVESTSSSSTAVVQDNKGTKRPASKSETSGEAPASKSMKTEGSTSIRPKSRSDLHLLYAQSTEEGSLPEARLLRSAGAAGANAGDEEDEGDEEDDVDYAPGEDEWRKTIMIGSDYQAYVPSGLSPYENSQTLPYENEDKLLWTPCQVAAPLTEEYLQKCTQIQQQLMQSRIAAATASQPLQTLALLASLPLGAHTRDDEQVPKSFMN
jgi:ELM2 domain